MNHGTTTAPDTRTCEAARVIGHLIDQWCDGWNAHDIRALATLMAADIVFVTVAGKRLIGRDEFREHHEAIHTAHLRDSTWHTLGWEWDHLPGGQFLIHLEWMIQGERDATGLSRVPRMGVFTWLVTATDASCRIRAAHNTDLRAGVHHRTAREASGHGWDSMEISNVSEDDPPRRVSWRIYQPC
jgi:ketosteroid isomerase-like protein